MNWVLRDLTPADDTRKCAASWSQALCSGRKDHRRFQPGGGAGPGREEDFVDGCRLAPPVHPKAVRYIPPEEYGAFVLLQVILTFLVAFTGFGLGLATPHSLVGTDEPLAKRQIINTTIWFRIIVSITTGILILVFRFDVPFSSNRSNN